MDTNKQRDADHWSKKKHPVDWAYGYFNSRFNELCYGDKSKTFGVPEVSGFAKQNPVVTVLGSGTGWLERSIAHMCGEVHCYDYSADRIAECRELAKGMNIVYHQADITEVAFEKSDLVFASMVLHHIDHLERLFENVKGTMTHESQFVIKEFVGPSHFQWTQHQVYIINEVLKVLPEHLREHCVTGQIKDIVYRPNKEGFIKQNPMEAIRSEEIVPLIVQSFKQEKRVTLPGVLSHQLFNYISPNFNTPDRVAVMQTVEVFERVLCEYGILKPNYVYMVLRKW